MAIGVVVSDEKGTMTVTNAEIALLLPLLERVVW